MRCWSGRSLLDVPRHDQDAEDALDGDMQGKSWMVVPSTTMTPGARAEQDHDTRGHLPGTTRAGHNRDTGTCAGRGLPV